MSARSKRPVIIHTGFCMVGGGSQMGGLVFCSDNQDSNAWIRFSPVVSRGTSGRCPYCKTSHRILTVGEAARDGLVDTTEDGGVVLNLDELVKAHLAHSSPRRTSERLPMLTGPDARP